MLNIPDEVKSLFKLDSCYKNFHVHFPNGEITDLNNENVVEESVQFSESICSQSTFKFGLSESSTIEFETVGVPNMMGKKIECGIEIDCTSLGAAWAAEHPVDNTLPFLTPQTVSIGGGEAEENTYTGNPADFIGSNDDRITSLSIPITPTQNLNGYTRPWPAGGGDNKFEPFSGTHNGVTFTAQEDGTVKITGEANATTWTSINQYVDLPWNGINAGDTVVLWSDIYAVVGSYEGSTLINNKSSENSVATSYTIPSNATRLRFYEYVKSTVPSAGEVFDVTGHYYFAKANAFSAWTPYSNICPITGLSFLSVYVSPTQNQADATTYALSFTEVLAGSIDPVLGAIKRRPVYSSYNGEPLTGPWLSSLDEYASGTTPTTGAQVVDLGGTETPESITPTAITLLAGQNYIWSSGGNVVTVKVVTGTSRLYYRIPYGLFTVRECPRDHQAMTHRKVTAYTDTRLLGTEYQKMLFDSKGFEKKYTPKFQNMFYASIGRNNESLILSAGYTKTAHDAFSSVIDSHQDDMIQFVVSGASKHFKLQVYMKVFTIGGSSQGAYTTDALYGIEGIENVNVSNLVEPIAKVLVDDYGVSEAEAYDYSTYDAWKKYPNSYPARYCLATVTKPKIIGFQARKDLSGGSYVTNVESQYVDLTGMSGLYCINPDREGFITYVSVLAGITVTPWSSSDLEGGYAIGDPISTYGSGFDGAFLNQYTTPSGSAFETELKLEPTGSEKTNTSGAPKHYWFTDAVDINKLMTDYLEVSALFAAQNRTGGLKVFSLDNSVLKEQLSAGEYSEFWWDEYDVSPIGKIKYIHTKKEEEEETTYTFGSGQSVYDLTQNEFFKQFKKSKSEIETFLNTSFVPKLGVVSFTPIELTVGNGLPYIEAGDYVQATSEDGVDAKSFVLTHTISGIQHLTESIESTGGDLMNSVFSEGN